MRNQWRMPKGYKMMDEDQLAEAVLKNKKNREMIERGLSENLREGMRYSDYASTKEQLAQLFRERKKWKEIKGMKSDNLSVVKSVQNSEYMKTRGQRGGENITAAYRRHYEAEWAAKMGYVYNPETGRTHDAKGRWVRNKGWDDVVQATGINTDTMEYIKETKQYRFRGKNGVYYYMNTTQTAHYEKEGYAITRSVLGVTGAAVKSNPYQKIPLVKIKK